MTDLAFEPALVSVRTAEVTRIEFDNRATQVHDFTVDRMPVADVRTRDEAGHDMTSMDSTKPSLHVAVAGGKSARIDFRPNESADYEFYCTVAGHREGGMRGTIRVE